MNTYLLFFIALAPIVWLMLSLGVLKMPGHKTCPITLIVTILLAVSVWKMPIPHAMTATLEGITLGLWPIMLVIVAAVFTYNLSIHTKSMDVIKQMLTGITTDKRILVLILAWGFGSFLEAIAGFGTAVAIPASIMVALGFEPVFAAIICLIANTTPTIFGGIGIPTVTLAKVTNLDAAALSYPIILQISILSLIIPIVLVILTGKSVKAIKGVLGVTLISGLSFALPSFLAAKYMGAELPSLLGSIICMGTTILVTKLFYKDASTNDIEKVSMKKGIMAWLPFILVFLFIILTTPLFPAIHNSLSSIKSSIPIYTGPNAKPFVFKWIATPGSLIIIATFLGGLIQGAKFNEIAGVFVQTCKQMTKTAVTILSIIAIAKVMGYSGMIKSIAQVLVIITGDAYPIFAPIIGSLGTFVTGSVTSSNVLFGGLQVEVAKSLGMNPYWLAAANGCGATAGKMISPQSIAVATAAIGMQGSEGKILNATLKVCVVYVAFLGIISYFAAPLFGI
ncbi:L-lactate permease [Clostridium ganghwense]|uniref:L-lactate permease n=1 Tax=Clostridium ganghwense TaxID=312089 RepID=A0ABT4CPR2_9CLOT|nr:L-lactate permease [Clostridium ganghwense]MCY6371042.1 L-lactate permease [Clostridium ganghwense]